MQQTPSSIPFLKSSWQVIVGFLAFTIVLLALYYVDTTYRIKSVNVVNNNDTIPVAGIPQIQGHYLFLTTEKDIADIITRTNPSVKSVEIIKQFPDTVQLRLTRHKPVAYLKSTDGYLQLADEAIILSKSSELSKLLLPVITYYQSIPFAQFQSGQQLPAKDIRDSLFFLRKLQEMGIRINSIDIAGFHMLGLYTEEKKYYFTSEKARNIQLYHVEQAIKKFKIENPEYKTIDVRFDKPVITF